MHRIRVRRARRQFRREFLNQLINVGRSRGMSPYMVGAGLQRMPAARRRRHPKGFIRNLAQNLATASVADLRKLRQAAV